MKAKKAKKAKKADVVALFEEFLQSSEMKDALRAAWIHYAIYGELKPLNTFINFLDWQDNAKKKSKKA